MAKSKPRTPMPVSERAKQFAPFSALTGLRRALEQVEREHMRVPKRELSEEMAQQLDQCLNGLKKGDTVTVTYFSQGEYLTVSGTVTSMDRTARLLTVGDVKMPIDDLYRIINE